MKKILIVALMLAMALAMGCPAGGGPAGEEYAGEDLSGNRYTLLIEGNSAHAEAGDRYTLTVNMAGGGTKVSTGTVAGVSADGTFTLEPDNGGAFTAVVSGDSLNSVAGEITFNDQTTFTPRTFDTIYLRAHWWEDSGYVSDDGKFTLPVGHGEQWNSSNVIWLDDFLTSVTELDSSGNYTVTISGTSDKKLEFITVQVHGEKNGKSIYLGGTDAYIPFEADVRTAVTVPLIVKSNDDGTRRVHDLVNEYANVSLAISNEVYASFSGTDDSGKAVTWEIDHRQSASIDGKEEGDIMASISGISISLRDTH